MPKAGYLSGLAWKAGTWMLRRGAHENVRDECFIAGMFWRNKRNRNDGNERKQGFHMLGQLAYMHKLRRIGKHTKGVAGAEKF